MPASTSGRSSAAFSPRRLAGDLEAEPDGDVARDAGGQGVLVGPLGRQDQHHPERAADLDDEHGVVAGLGAVAGVREQVLALVDHAHQRAQPQRAALGDLAGDALVRAQLPRQPLQRGGAAHHLGAQQPQRLGGVGDRLVLDAGHEPVRDLRVRVEVAGALQLVDPQLAQRVQRRAAGQHDGGAGLALAGDGADQHVVLDQRDGDGPAAGVDAERDGGEHVVLA